MRGLAPRHRFGVAPIHREGLQRFQAVREVRQEHSIGGALVREDESLNSRLKAHE